MLSCLGLLSWGTRDFLEFKFVLKQVFQKIFYKVLRTLLSAKLCKYYVQYIALEDSLCVGGPRYFFLNAVMNDELNLVAVDPVLIVNAHVKQFNQVLKAV